jgi:hypothetical protein
MAGPLLAIGAAVGAAAAKQALKRGVPLAAKFIRMMRKRISETQRKKQQQETLSKERSDLEIKEPQEVRKRVRKRMGRDYPDVRLKDRPRELARKFLEDHGYTEAMSGRKPQTFVERGDSVTAFTEDSAGGIEQKTFTNPTLKQMRDWMRY